MLLKWGVEVDSVLMRLYPWTWNKTHSLKKSRIKQDQNFDWSKLNNPRSVSPHPSIGRLASQIMYVQKWSKHTIMYYPLTSIGCLVLMRSDRLGRVLTSVGVDLSLERTSVLSTGDIFNLCRFAEWSSALSSSTNIESVSLSLEDNKSSSEADEDDDEQATTAVWFCDFWLLISLEMLAPNFPTGPFVMLSRTVTFAERDNFLESQAFRLVLRYFLRRSRWACKRNDKKQSCLSKHRYLVKFRALSCTNTNSSLRIQKRTAYYTSQR